MGTDSVLRNVSVCSLMPIWVSTSSVRPTKTKLKPIKNTALIIPTIFKNEFFVKVTGGNKSGAIDLVFTSSALIDSNKLEILKSLLGDDGLIVGRVDFTNRSQLPLTPGSTRLGSTTLLPTKAAGGRLDFVRSGQVAVKAA